MRLDAMRPQLARWCCRAMLGLCALLSTTRVVAAVGDDYYAPLAWSGGPVGYRDTPQQVCATGASWWGWDRNGYSYTTEFLSPGLYRCQRFFQGAREPSWYFNVSGECQRNASTILTGSDWSYPWYDTNHDPSCYCYAPKKFDRRTEWCTAYPSCMSYPNSAQTECGQTVGRLLAVSKAATDPTRVFHQTQTCIARVSCDARCKMEDCNWLKAVLPDFVAPYMEKAGRWSAIEAECRRATGWVADRDCAQAMARYHIANDLGPALIRFGCGSSADWNKVFDAIASCTRQTFSTAFESAVSQAVVLVYRNLIRSRCLAVREAAGENREINDDLRGSACTP